MNDYNDIIESEASVAPSLAITSLDENPDDGARALQLSRATGVAPNVIHADLDGFQRDHKASLTSQIVSGNGQLQDYLRGNPLADVVSNDDYGNLDKFSKNASALQQIHQMVSPGRFIEPVAEGIKRGISEGAADAWNAAGQDTFKYPDNWNNASKFAWELLGIPLRTLNTAIAGATGAAAGFASGAVEDITGSDTQGSQIGRDVRGMVEDIMGRGGPSGFHGEIKSSYKSPMERTADFQRASADYGQSVVDAQNTQAISSQLQKVQEAVTAARPWIESGMEPPAGVHPLIDETKAELNKSLVDQLGENLKDAQDSLTRERDPISFSNFAAQHYGDSSISISADRVLSLYGDKIPEAGDNLLGWVPGIEEKLQSARELGTDVHVPIKDWLANVDPKLAKDLHDDIRAWPGGITETEAKLAKEEQPRAVVDSPLAQVRDVSSTEPMFALGDRKLQLQKLPEEAMFEGVHDYHILNQDGEPIGEVSIIPDEKNKQLYVSNINGLGGLWSNSFGPSLVRDLKRQLKELYPDFETISGHRVTGMRERAGTAYNDDYSVPIVKLAADGVESLSDLDNFHNMIEVKYLQKFEHDVHGLVLPKELYTRNELKMISAVRDELRRIAPEADFTPTAGLSHPSADGIQALHLQNADKISHILVDMLSPDSIGLARHEAIHHLRSAGLFTDPEWAELRRAALSENWLDRYAINDRYGYLDVESRIEESIAEGYRDWARNRNVQPDTVVGRAFQKLHDFLERIKDRLREVFGKDITSHDLFEKVHTGEVGERGILSREGDVKFAVDEHFNNLRAEAAGLDKKSYTKIQDLIRDRYKEDLEAAQKRAEREQKKTQTAEWKSNREALRKEVEASIKQRPDVAADLLVGSGEVDGKKVRQRIPLNSADLTAEQKASLPRHYYSETGVPVDEVAKIFGYHSGDALVERLAEYNAEKGNLTAQQMLKKTVEAETDRQMELKYGKLEENIMSEAVDQALSETNLNLTAEEWQGVAMKTGQAVDKVAAKAEAQKLFGEMQLDNIDLQRIMAGVGKFGRDAERALIANKPADALVNLQKKYMTQLIAAEARKLEKERASFDRTARQFAKRDVPSVPKDYQHFIQQVLTQVGKKVNRSLEDIAKEIGKSSTDSLQKFSDQAIADGREMPIWDQLFDESWRKDLGQLTVDEFRAVNGSIKTMIHNGRAEQKVIRQGEAMDLNTAIDDLVGQLRTELPDTIKLDDQGHRATGLSRGIAGRALRNYVTSHIVWETTFNRWDHGDSKGVWNQIVARDLIDAVNQRDSWKKEFSAKLGKLESPDNLHRTLENVLFKQPGTDHYIPFTRKNLLAVMMNTGNETNLVKLAHGYGLESQQVMNWVHQNATPKDWAYVQGVWDLFREIKDRSDTMYRSISGVPAKDIPIRPVLDNAGREVAKGGYYPLIRHEVFGDMGKSSGLLDNNYYVKATVPAGYTKDRTGAIYPLSLDADGFINNMSQQLHDIALRPAILNVSKVLENKRVREAIRNHAGPEYEADITPWLRYVANSANYISQNQALAESIGGMIRSNAISTLVGLNPGTMMKHGITAFGLSIKEIGPTEFLRAVKDLYTVDPRTNKTASKFIDENSLEIQRRDRNWMESLYGATGELRPGSNLSATRQTIMQYASKPIAFLDMLSAKPTWLATYRREIADGAAHGDAVYEADRAVRRSHGSTADTNRPAAVRESSPWLTQFYTFFNDIMNRQMEQVWKAGEMRDLVKEGEYKSAAKVIPGLTAGVFATAIFPALVENLVSPQHNEPDDSWGKKVAKQMTFTLGASWIGVREFTAMLTEGYSPQYGLYGTVAGQGLKLIQDLNKDRPLNREHAGKLIQDASMIVGLTTGMFPAVGAHLLRYGHDVYTGQERPRGPWSWLVGARYGTTDKHSRTFDEYWRGRH